MIASEDVRRVTFDKGHAGLSGVRMWTTISGRWPTVWTPSAPRTRTCRKSWWSWRSASTSTSAEEDTLQHHPHQRAAPGRKRHQGGQAEGRRSDPRRQHQGRGPGAARPRRGGAGPAGAGHHPQRDGQFQKIAAGDVPQACGVDLQDTGKRRDPRRGRGRRPPPRRSRSPPSRFTRPRRPVYETPQPEPEQPQPEDIPYEEPAPAYEPAPQPEEPEPYYDDPEDDLPEPGEEKGGHRRVCHRRPSRTSRRICARSRRHPPPARQSKFQPGAGLYGRARRGGSPRPQKDHPQPFFRQPQPRFRHQPQPQQKGPAGDRPARVL